MGGVLLLDDQLVARPAEQLGPGPLVPDPGQRAAPGRVGLDQEVIVLDHRAGLRLPAAGGSRGGRHPPGAVAQRGHGGPERHGDLGQSAAAAAQRALGQERHRGPGLVQHGDLRRSARRELQGGAGQPGPRPGQRVEHGQRAGPGRGRARAGPAGVRLPGEERGRRAAGRVAPVPRLPPAAQQIQVHLVGLGPGDRVVVRAEHQLPPRLVQRLRRVAVPGQPGQGGQRLTVADGHLGGPLGLLGVDVGDVLARVDRVHVPGLREQPDVPAGRVLAHRGEELPGQRGDEPRPHVAGVPVAVDGGHPAARDHVVGADREQHVAGRRDRGQRAELVQRGLLGAGQVRGLMGDPARPVVVRHVAGEQAAAVRGEPLELAAQLHPGVVADGAQRAPLVVGPAGPGGGGQAGRGHQAGVPRVVPEHVEHPGGPRVAAGHLALVGQAVDGVADGGFGAGQVGVGLVVVAADDLHPAVGNELAQLGPVLGAGVQVGLEIVDLGQDELVVGVLAGVRQVQRHQLERGAHLGQLAVGAGQQQPGLGELALGVPPHRVVVEVADHPHGPAGVRDPDLGRLLGPPRARLGDHRDPPRPARLGRRGDVHAEFRGHLPTRFDRPDVQRPRRGHSRALGAQPDRAGRLRAVALHGDPDQLQRPLSGPAEQVGAGDLGDPHGLHRGTVPPAGQRPSLPARSRRGQPAVRKRYFERTLSNEEFRE